MAETTHTEWRRGQLREQRNLFHSLLFNSSALYYLQTPTQRYGRASTPPQFLPISGDRDVSLPLSLEWPVWSSSSGNNYYAVHRSLSSGASLWSGTFTLSHIISRAHLRDFFRLLAIGMCHFLPVHHLGMAFLAGSKAKIQQNCLIRIIIISYLKYNCVQRNDCY